MAAVATSVGDEILPRECVGTNRGGRASERAAPQSSSGRSLPCPKSLKRQTSPHRDECSSSAACSIREGHPVPERLGDRLRKDDGVQARSPGRSPIRRRLAGERCHGPNSRGRPAHASSRNDEFGVVALAPGMARAGSSSTPTPTARRRHLASPRANRSTGGCLTFWVSPPAT